MRAFSLSLGILSASFITLGSEAQDLAPFATVSTTGVLPDQIADFLAENSVQSSSLRTSGPVTDLVRETCGSVSPNNLEVFRRAIVNQGGTVSSEGVFSVPTAYTQVPACLPDEREVRLVGRLPSSADTWSQIFERDLSTGFYASRGLLLLPSLATLPDGAVGAGDDRTDALGEAGVDLAGIAAAGADPSTEAEVAQAIAADLEAQSVDPNDRGRVAYETFALSSELLDAGLDRTTTMSVAEQALRDFGSAQIDQVLGDVGAALDSGQTVPQIAEVPIFQDQCALMQNLCDTEASGTVVQLDQISGDIATLLNPPSRARDIDTIYRNVPILSAEPVASEAKVPLRSGATAQEGVPIHFEAPNDPSKVRLFLNVLDVENDEQRQCSRGPYQNWGTDAFRQRFRAALEEALRQKVSRDGEPRTTQTLVLDGGFFRFEPQSFGGVDWNTLPSDDHHASFVSLTGMPDEEREKTEHGTAVTSIALGGPGLMDLGQQLNLPITVVSQPIYRVELINGRREYRLIKNIDDAIAHSEEDIVNISFGSVDDNEGAIRKIKETLLGRAGKLLIVAAGNLGDNGGQMGSSVRSTGLVPQEWGGEDAAKSNMIVVAGMDPANDPSRLAWFSNFGDDVVFLGAPACDVPALRATTEGTYEVATYNGTSFAAPIVTFVASAVRTVMPKKIANAPWIRARLLATADIEAGVYQDKINLGRVLNPVAAVQVYTDIVTLKEPLADGTQVLGGEILEIAGEPDFTKGSLCEEPFNKPHHLLRLFRDPRGGDGAGATWKVDLMGPGDVMETQPCTPRGSDPLTLRGIDPLRIDAIDDIKFGFTWRME